MRWLFVVACLLQCFGCKQKRVEAGGVAVEPEAHSTELKGGSLHAHVGGNDDEVPGQTSIALTPFEGRPKVTFEVRAGSRVLGITKRVVDTSTGVAAIRHVLDGEDASLTVTIDPGIPAVEVRAHARLPAGEPLDLRASFAREKAPILLDRGGPWLVDLPSTQSADLVMVAPTPLLFASPQGMSVSATSTVVATARGTTDAKIVIATAPFTKNALDLGAKIAGVPPRKGTDALLETFDAKTQAAVPARVVIVTNGVVKDHVWDDRREAERTMPVVDVAGGRTVASLPVGHHTLLATRGMGWSIARREVDVFDGDARQLSFELKQEHTHPGWIGCDFHVHAKLSFDASTVSYEDRVRSLAAVGVECAAATEHDHVGDHGPAATALGLDDVFRAIRGVELTTLAPTFGHFNVYPWPDGGVIPKVHATNAEALFDAVHKLPGSWILQVNHPRLRNADGSTIGYFDIAGIDPKSGNPLGSYHFRRDYDAIEVFNGYELHDLPPVRRMILEWISMLDRGDVHVATGSSDAHTLTMPWAGFPRTMVRVGEGWREAGRPIAAIVDALKHGRAYVTSGPLLDLRIGDATIGDETKAGLVHLEVGATSWLAPPSATLHLGTSELGAMPMKLDASRNVWVGEMTIAAPTKRRPLVAVVEADVIGDAIAVTGLPRTLAVTNPIWIAP
ncbi:MAG: CehA/McbA family metallohydrolase [Polyangiales bacterium]